MQWREFFGEEIKFGAVPSFLNTATVRCLLERRATEYRAARDGGIKILGRLPVLDSLKDPLCAIDRDFSRADDKNYNVMHAEIHYCSLNT